MSIDDEILQRKQNIQTAADAQARRQADTMQLKAEYDAVGMSLRAPIICMPPQDLQAVISEAMHLMAFNAPKIIRSMPDGTIRVRCANGNERADDYSFDLDVNVDKKWEGVNTEDECEVITITSIWFFRNGSVVYCKGLARNYLHSRYSYQSRPSDWSYINTPGVTAAEIREKIIEKIVNTPDINKTNTNSAPNPNTQTSTSEGCYIATAVYESYDCPEVWILRRYRDYTLRSTWVGRLFVKIYYAISPSLVKVFGNKKWFQNFWRKRLDSLTNYLKKKGFSDKPYNDK